MADLTYTLYDTAQPSTTALAEILLFQVPRGGDSTHTESFTNMNGAGALPGQESMIVKNIGVTVDAVIPQADVAKVWAGSILEFIIADFTVLKAPLIYFTMYNDYNGVIDQATAANLCVIGPVGEGYTLENPVKIPGQVPFKIRYLVGTALSASLNVKVCLNGIYSKVAGQQ